MKSELKQPFFCSFELTEQELRRIYSIMVKQIKLYGPGTSKSYFEVKYKNGIKSEKASLEEIINESNSEKWLIYEVRIAVIHSSAEAKIIMHFRVPPPPVSKDHRVSYSIEYIITGKMHDWVTLTRSQLDERIAIIKTARLDNYGAAATVIGFVCAFFSLATFSRTNGIYLPLGYSIVALIASFLLATAGIALIRGFTSYAFYWGDNMKVVDRKRSLSKYIINTIIASFVLGIIGSIISTIFFLK